MRHLSTLACCAILSRFERRRKSRGRRAQQRHEGNSQYAWRMALPGIAGRDGLHRLVGDFRSMDRYARPRVGLLSFADSGDCAAAHVALQARRQTHRFQIASDYRRRRAFLRTGPGVLQHFHPADLRSQRHDSRQQHANLRRTPNLAGLSTPTSSDVLAWTGAGDRRIAGHRSRRFVAAHEARFG